MKRIPAKSAQEVVDRLKDLDGGDPGRDRAEADELLLDAIRLVGGHEVAEAWTKAHDRVGFWYD